MKHRFLRLTAMLLCLCMLLPFLAACQSGEAEDCEDGVCQVPTYDEAGNQVYAIVSPVGYCSVESIEQAPRLDSLDGKTIALVGGSFNASVTHGELIRQLKENYPDVTIYSFDEVGAGGPFSVYGQTAKTKAFQEKLQELKVDAVISGNCGCGLCTTKETGSSIAAEYIGIPTVTVGAPTFAAQIHSTGVNRGVPVLRVAEYPGAFSSDSREELEKNARETLFPQVVKGLTEPITDKEIKLYAGAGKRPYDEIVYYGSYDEIQDYCLVNEWTDGLPVTPPTDERVREYLRFVPDAAEDVLGSLPLAYRECTVYTLAANAVMAGVPKECMPLCVAFVKCMADGNWRRPLASTHGWSPYAWINGPLARQLGIDCEQGMISEEMNKALGRFMDLAMLNLGGYYVKENRMGTYGYLTPFTFAENEDACLAAGWEPYHVTKGFDRDDNTLTAASALAWGNNVTPATDDGEIIALLLAWDITEKEQNGLGNTNPQVPRTILITEPVARDLAEVFSSKDALEDRLIELARRPLFMRAFANYWANTGSNQSARYDFESYYQKLLADPEEKAALTDVPDWLRGFVSDEKIETVATMLKGDTAILVTGDGDRNKFMVLPGGETVTMKIELPENWDELVAPMGYEPLENFILTEGTKPPKKETGKEPETSTGEVTLTAGIPAGTYRLVPSPDQVTDPFLVHVSAEGELTMQNGEGERYTPDLNNQGRFKKLLSCLGFGCSFTVAGGRVTEVIFRPSSVSRKPVTDASRLTADDLAGVKLTLALNLKKSKAGGGATPDGSGVTFSESVTDFSLDLGGSPAADSGNTPGFLTLDGQRLTIARSAAKGATGKIGVRHQNGGWRILTFTKNDNGTVSARYQENGSIA